MDLIPYMPRINQGILPLPKPPSFGFLTKQCDSIHQGLHFRRQTNRPKTDISGGFNPNMYSLQHKAYKKRTDRFYWTRNLRRSKKLQQEGLFLGALPQGKRRIVNTQPCHQSEKIPMLDFSDFAGGFPCLTIHFLPFDSKTTIMCERASQVQIKVQPSHWILVFSWIFTMSILKKIHSCGSHSQQKRPKNQPLGAATSHQVIRWRGVSHSMPLFWPSSMARRSATKALPPKKRVGNDSKSL